MTLDRDRSRLCCVQFHLTTKEKALKIVALLHPLMGSCWGFRAGRQPSERHERTMSLQASAGARSSSLRLRPVRPKAGRPAPDSRKRTKSAAAAAPARGSPPLPRQSRHPRLLRHFYPGTSTSEWNDWRWQMRSRIRTLEDLARIFHLSDDERQRGRAPRRARCPWVSRLITPA